MRSANKYHIKPEVIKIETKSTVVERNGNVPNSNLEARLVDKEIELLEILQGLVLASSGVRGLALTVT